jgi:hypothetical protein
VSVAEMPVVFLRNDERTSLMGFYAIREYFVHMESEPARRQDDLGVDEPVASPSACR